MSPEDRAAKIEAMRVAMEQGRRALELARPVFDAFQPAMLFFGEAYQALASVDQMQADVATAAKAKADTEAEMARYHAECDAAIAEADATVQAAQDKAAADIAAVKADAEAQTASLKVSLSDLNKRVSGFAQKAAAQTAELDAALAKRQADADFTHAAAMADYAAQETAARARLAEVQAQLDAVKAKLA